MTIKIDEPWEIEASIYVHAHKHPIGCGWGVVIERQGATTELGGHSFDDTVPRLLHEGVVEALATLPDHLPVRIMCSINCLTEHSIPRLKAMHQDRYKGKQWDKLKHLDLLKELHKRTWRRVYVHSHTVPKAQSDCHHHRAEDLARQWTSPFASPLPRIDVA